MSAGQLIFRNIRVLALAKAVTLLTGLIATAWTARSLGPEHFGIIGFGSAFLGYALLFVNLGLSTYAIREIAHNHDKAPLIVDHVLTMRILLALVSGCVYGLVVLAIDMPPLVKAVLWVQTAQLLGNALIIDFFYQGAERMGVIATREIGTSLATMLAVLALVHGPDDVVAAASITAASIVLNATLVLVRYSREIRLPRLRFDAAVWRVMLIATAPMAISVFSWTVFSNLDVVMLGFMTDPTQVGWYAASYKVVMLSATGGHIIVNSFLPQLAATYGDAEGMRARMRDYATTMLLAGVLISVTGLALAPEILLMFFGHSYTPAVHALRLLMAALGVMYLNMVLGNPLLVWHRQTGYMTAILIGGGANALLNLILIPRWGMEGAASATLAAELICTIGLAWQHHRAVGQLYFGAIAKAWACGLVTIFCWLTLKPVLPLIFHHHPLLELVLGGLSMALIYALVVPFTGLVALSRLRRLVGAAS